MNRPVIGTISILALLGGGLYFAYTYKDKAMPGAVPAYEGAAARSAIQAWLDLPLPASARNVYCMTENIEPSKLVYACFEIPTVDLPSIFDQPQRFPIYSELVADPGLVQAMNALADARRTWWKIDPKGAVCAQKSGKRNVAPATLKWRAQVCSVPISPEMSRVFVAFSEEPAEAKQE
jgi:hypothetical protein